VSHNKHENEFIALSDLIIMIMERRKKCQSKRLLCGDCPKNSDNTKVRNITSTVKEDY
jgi:hypothetical protein